ncbi:MAG: PAS domain-containing protein, partial [Woeseiaceae bacterium]
MIRHERQYLAALIESSPLPIVSLDTENRIVNCNPAFESLFLFD